MSAEFDDLRKEIERLRLGLAKIEKNTSGVKGVIIAAGGVVAAVIIVALILVPIGLGPSTQELVKAAVTEYRMQSGPGPR